MTSIFSGQLYRNLVKDQNSLRLESYDVNRFQKTVAQQTNQSQREKSLREGLEFHQAIMADLQTKLNEVTEKLNNLYRRFMDNQVTFLKPNYPATSNNNAVAGLPRVDLPNADPDYPNTTGYPAGASGIVPHDDYDKIRNFSYNPYFGSKAIDQSDKNVIRTFYEEPGATAETAYRENGAFWSTLSYLWGWDLDRINATYTTGDILEGREDVQINITALQPNKPQYPPLRVGDRFSMNWTGDGTMPAGYPAVNFSGLRPGGVDYSHAADSINSGLDSTDPTPTAASNVTGHDSLNFGWEFDDLPLALEVAEIETRADGSTVPTSYKVVYDIPTSHPHYAELRILNGTEPQIMDAPTMIQRDLIGNPGVEYSGYFYFPGTLASENYTITTGTHNTGGPWQTNTAENEYPPPKLFSAGFVPGVSYNTIGGSDIGNLANPVRLSNADLQLFGSSVGIEFTTDGSTWTSTTIQDVQYNSTTAGPSTGQGTGPGDLIVSTGSLDAFNNGDVLLINGRVYQISALFTGTPAGVFGFQIVAHPTLDSLAPVPPVPAVATGSTTIQLRNAANSGPKYATEGLIISPTSGGPDILQIRTPGQAGATTPVATFRLTACTDIVGNIDLDNDGFADVDLSAAKVSMNYRFTVHQNYKEFASPPPLDDNSLGSIPSYDWENNDWSSASASDIHGTGIPQGGFGYPLAGVPWSYTQNAPMGAGVVTLGTEDSASVVASTSAYFNGFESVRADLVPGATANEVILRVFYEGDLNAFEMEINDVQIVRYDGTLNTWEQGKYNSGNIEPIIMDGDPTITQTSTPNEVINKYIPGVYQFTQFNDQYNNGYQSGDMNDIVRSPWEFADLEFGEGSGLSGELWVDINSRRVNLAGDDVEATIPGWGTLGAASADSPSTYEVGIGAVAYSHTSAAVQRAHDFTVLATPGDECIAIDPESNSEANTFTDSDPLTTGPLATATHNDLLWDEVRDGEGPLTSPLTAADPLRTSNPGVDRPDFYSQNLGVPPLVNLSPLDYVGGGANDTTGTYDRVAASVKGASNDFNYHLTIPTTDVNVLRKENNLLLNLGSIEQRDWAMNMAGLDMYVRTVPEYVTVPRYRVDAGGNIFDNFGKGYYNLSDPDDLASYNAVYPVGTNPATGNAIKNGQVSNFNGGTGLNAGYENMPGAYNTAGTFETMVNTHDRLSMAGDDYNLFDYVPDLNLDPGSKEGGTAGEVYVGSFPSNFYYYRELLDQSDNELGTDPATGNHTTPSGTPLNFNNDRKPAINFDGRNTNLDGQYDVDHTYVYNAEMPSFVNVTLGIVEQNAKLNNTERTGTFAVWQDFPGLGSPLSYAIAYENASNVSNPTSSLGSENTTYTAMLPATSTITLDMDKDINSSGYLVINEMIGSEVQPHAIPLPMIAQPTGPFPNPDISILTPSSFTFNGYGAGTVTRTGSKFMSFSSILDGADGAVDSAYAPNVAANMVLLENFGGEFATLDPAGTPDTWPNGLLVHVDDAAGFDLEYPKNIVTFGTSTDRYRIVYRNTSTEPQTMFMIPDTGSPALTTTISGVTTAPGLVHADLQIREVTGQFTVTVVDDAGMPTVTGSKLKIDYDDLGTDREGRLESVGLSNSMDRVGRIPDDYRTPLPTIETNIIGPELFDSPRGYVQPDAQVDLHLVSQDTEGNKKPRKLVSVRVDVESGEQIIPTDLRQTYTTYGAAADFDVRGGTFGDWPIAIYDGDYQINPEVTNDLNYMVGYYQGITASSTTTSINVVDTDYFKVGHKVTINGEQRTITAIPTPGAGGTITLDSPLSYPPKLGDRVDLGDGTGNHDVKLFLNRSLAMSMGAGLRITLEYEEYEYTGYPPTVDTSVAGTPVTEVIGYGDQTPRSLLQIDSANTGDGSTGNGILIKNTAALAAYTASDVINVNGQTYQIAAITGGNRIELGDYSTNTPVALSIVPQGGNIGHIDYESFLQVGNGRKGGSTTNEFTEELKRIIDNPEYKELLRHDLLKNVFITAAISDPFNDLIASKITITWDRWRREAEIKQASFMAYYKSI